MIDGRIDHLCVFDAHNLDFFEVDGKSRWDFSVKNIAPKKEINDIIVAKNINLVVFPDASAKLRYEDLIDIPSVAVTKVRDQLTGAITHVEMPEIKSGQNILVVDDLCDGGFTFTEVAKLINPHSPNFLALYVSHGIFSKGTQIIYNAGYNEIYTKDGLI
jgi:ribose-phosphate pyrophosphokinase